MLELVCRVYNINKGHNKELRERCKWLSDYMTFVDKVREFFETRKTEVLRMTKVDYTFEHRMKLN